MVKALHFVIIAFVNAIHTCASGNILSVSFELIYGDNTLKFTILFINPVAVVIVHLVHSSSDFDLIYADNTLKFTICFFIL